MQILNDQSLITYNTFHLEARARYFAEVTCLSDLLTVLSDPTWKEYPKMILGGGSNMLLLHNIDALVLRMAIKGIDVVKENTESVWLKAGAGELWHQLVMHCVDAGVGGIENLSLIPGTVGAAPMQNIGAYGVEIKDVFEELEAVEIRTGTIRTFNKEECNFGYRESIFKKELKDRYIITSVTLRLSKKPELKISYGDIKKTLEHNGHDTITIKNVSDAVIQIRKSKLPDPAEIGNAGSFFKNPEIPKVEFEKLKNAFPELPGYETPATDFIKVPAGWLIEHAGWKGYREGQAGVHAKQALVLVNYGGARGEEIKNLSQKIQTSVLEKYGIMLTPEVNFI